MFQTCSLAASADGAHLRPQVSRAYSPGAYAAGPSQIPLSLSPRQRHLHVAVSAPANTAATAMPRAYHITCVAIAGPPEEAGWQRRWVWRCLHWCWCRRLNKLGRIRTQVENWYPAGIWRLQVTTRRALADYRRWKLGAGGVPLTVGTAVTSDVLQRCLRHLAALCQRWCSQAH